MLRFKYSLPGFGQKHQLSLRLCKNHQLFEPFKQVKNAEHEKEFTNWKKNRIGNRTDDYSYDVECTNQDGKC